MRRGGSSTRNSIGNPATSCAATENHLQSVTSTDEDELAGIGSLTVLEETLPCGQLAGECLPVLICFCEESGLITLRRPFYFRTIVDAKFTRRWPIEAQIAVALIDICAKSSIGPTRSVTRPTQEVKTKTGNAQIRQAFGSAPRNGVCHGFS